MIYKYVFPIIFRICSFNSFLKILRIIFEVINPSIENKVYVWCSSAQGGFLENGIYRVSIFWLNKYVLSRLESRWFLIFIQISHVCEYPELINILHFFNPLFRIFHSTLLFWEPHIFCAASNGFSLSESIFLHFSIEESSKCSHLILNNL